MAKLSDKPYHQTSTGPFGTGMCVRVIESGSRMKDATSGAC